jgi:hypothetical protein
MRRLDSKIAIEQYYDKVKHLYPHITFEQFKESCKGQFEYTAKQMASGELPVIRLKYFGTFLVYPKKAEASLRRINERFRFGKIDKNYYFRMREMLQNFLNRNESKNHL